MNPNIPGSGSPSNTPGKQVIYVDVDDEITAIIDKMNASSARVIALVLPKRAAVFQSVVNMKLLKRRADNAKKHLVLITSEAGLMPLAGIAGIHVASTLQSKPEIPSGPLDIHRSDEDDGEETAVMTPDSETDDGQDFDASRNAGASIGALAAKNSAAADDEGVIELDNTAKAGLASKLKSPAPPKATAKAAKPDKKLKVPNFFSFRKKLLLAGLAVILLAVGWYYAFFVMPKATVTIMTNSSDINSNLNVTLDTAAGKVDTDKEILPAQTKQEQKSNTQQVPATGQQNKGNKATGTVVMTANVCGTPTSPADVPAGTGITTNGLTFITQKTATFGFDGISGGCIHFKSDSVSITAQTGGSNFNVSSATFSVRSDTTATGSTSGGTDNNVKVVQQSDIDAATQKLSSSQDQNALKNQLQGELEDDNLVALPATFSASTPNINTSSSVGDEADTVTVTQSVTYTMFGVRKDDLTKLVEASVNKQIDTSKQSIQSNGVDQAKITTATAGPGPQLKVTVATTSTVGPVLDIAAIKREIVGMKSGNVQDKIKQHVGVENVEVRYSPFWVTKAPKPERTTIVFEKANKSNDSSNDKSNDSDQ